MRSNFLYIGIGGAILVLAGGIALFLQHAPPASGTAESAAAAQTASQSLVDDQPAIDPATLDCGQAPGIRCIEYRNEKYRFSIYHSERREVKEYDEGGGAATIVFQNTDLVRGIQIFIVPYSGTAVSPERFRKDNPSGIRKNEVGVTVDGAVGAAFESKSLTLGDTYEIWFLHGGYLYEITTLLSLKDSLNKKMQTWRFLD